MKIFEIVEVNPVKDFKQDLNKGVSAVKKFTQPLNKLFSPDHTDKTAAVDSDLDVRDSITAALQGKIYLDDIQVLKKLIADIRSGTIAVDDPKFTVAALKTALNKQPLSEPAKANLQQLIAQLS